jgi:hypothetical protein
MFDEEFFKYLTTLGIGGVIAALIFMFYRKDIKVYTDLWKQTTDLLILIIKENTASNVKLISLIEQQERNAIRKEDIVNLIDRKFHDRGLP